MDLPHLLLSLLQTMEFSIRYFSSKYGDSLEKSLMENFIFCSVMTYYFQALNSSHKSRNIETFCIYLKYANTNTRHAALHSML